jgi:hypothetical protein
MSTIEKGFGHSMEYGWKKTCACGATYNDPINFIGHTMFCTKKNKK